MLFRNLLPGLLYEEAFLVLILLAVISIVLFFVYRPKLKWKYFLTLIPVAIIFSLASMVFYSRGTYKGPFFEENYGWPLEFFTLERGYKPWEFNSYYYTEFAFFVSVLLSYGWFLPVLFIFKSEKTMLMKWLGILISFAIIYGVTLLLAFS